MVRGGGGVVDDDRCRGHTRHRIGTEKAHMFLCCHSSPVRIRCMDRASLEQLLGQGLSLAEIGRRFDLHEATVGYWVRKRGLQAVNHEKHASRGGIAKGELEALVAAGRSIAQIAETVGRSKGTVRHWLSQHGLKTHAQEGRLGERSTRAAKAAGKATLMRKWRLSRVA